MNIFILCYLGAMLGSGMAYVKAEKESSQRIFIKGQMVGATLLFILLMVFSHYE